MQPIQDLLISDDRAASIPIYSVTKKKLPSWTKKQPDHIARWLKNSQFAGDIGSFFLVPGKNRELESVILGVPDITNIWSFAGLPSCLPKGTYHLADKFPRESMEQFALGWLLGAYSFTRYRKTPMPERARLKIPSTLDLQSIAVKAESIALVRNLINTPANDMTPLVLAKACQDVAKRYGAKYRVIVGNDLVSENYPAIHAVGRASDNKPCLVDMRWGKESDPKVTLVGKGVCFDSGGLDIKNASGMKLMKKDMGGAAAVLGLAQMIMAANLPVRLRVMIPAVENSISGNAFRPMDIIKTRSGMTVEIGNTDAEGRVILCDALHEADSEHPDLLIDCATLTGAARVALGTDIPAYFTNDGDLVEAIDRFSRSEYDPLWRLPLWSPYRDMLSSTLADINNASDSSYAGAITAALYLRDFVKHTLSWVHIDMMAWNMGNRPGRPSGGEAMAIRALFSVIEERYGKKNSKKK